MDTKIGKKTVTGVAINDDFVIMEKDPRSSNPNSFYFLSTNTIDSHCQDGSISCPSLRFVRGGWHYCTVNRPDFPTSKDHGPSFNCPISKPQSSTTINSINQPSQEALIANINLKEIQKELLNAVLLMIEPVSSSQKISNLIPEISEQNDQLEPINNNDPITVDLPVNQDVLKNGILLNKDLA